MGCTQSKTNEQEVVDPNAAPVEVSASEPEQASIDSADCVEAEEEPVPVKESPIVEVEAPDSILEFVAGEVSFNEYGVAYYNFDGSNPADPTQEIHVCKRFSEFKDLHADISKLMASEKNVEIEDLDKFKTFPALPSMPRANAATFILGRDNRNVVKERETQFVKILNAIAKHPIAFQSQPFNDFLA